MDDRASQADGGAIPPMGDMAVAARASRVVQVIAALAVLILALALATWLAGGRLPDWQMAGSTAALVLGIASLVLLRRGRPRWGVLALAAAIWAHVAWPMVWLGLRYSLLGTRFAVLPLALVALLLGRRDLWGIFTAFVVTALLGAARDAGWLGPPTILPTLMPTQPLLSTLLLFLFAALLLDQLAVSLRRALREALRGNQALREREQMREQLRQAQKMEAIGRLAGGVAHDFNNILTSILAAASFAREELPDGHPARTDIDQISEDGKRAAELTRQLLAFARKQVVAPQLLVLDDVVSDMAKMLRRLLGDGIVLETELGAHEAMVLVDRGQLEQVLLNLAVNARDAMPTGGHLRIATEAQARSGGDGQVLLRVRDEGMGIPAEVLPHIFEPFFTTKSAEQGTGLGLATCHGIVAQAGGEITVDSTPGHGSCFQVRFPLAGSDYQQVVEAEAKPAWGTETVMVVEDQEVVRKSAARTLRSYRYSVLEADGMREAVRVATLYQGDIDLAILDLGLRDGSGREVAEVLRRTRPRMRFLFTSGSPDRQGTGAESVDGRFLRKPFEPAELAAAVRRSLDPT